MHTLDTYIQTYFHVPQDDLQVIASKFKLVELRKEEYFLREGKFCDRLAFVRSGLLRISRNVDGKEVTQWISTEGYFVTDLASFVFDTPGRWDIQALTDCELFSIDRQSYLGLADSIPRWKDLDKLFIARCFILLEERIFSHLHMTAGERFQKLMSENPELFNQVPLQYLASMLGMTPETLSRLRKKALE
ncbi:MAG TPA: Crp/Fnr family transcriptional regulator [Saprospiraceae bacterium]|nr:Crp/Fnr family transcriptional regulator [Saprospiraceae bacterium]